MDIAFSGLVSSFSLAFGSPYSGTVYLDAYDASGNLVDSDNGSLRSVCSKPMLPRSMVRVTAQMR